MSASDVQPLGGRGPQRPVRDVVAALRLRDGGPDGRARVIAAMVASADGRAAVDGSAAGLGSPADRTVLRELRAAVDVVLVGTGTLRAERYANLLDDHQRQYRVAAGLEPEPILATVARRLDVPADIPIFAERRARMQVYTEAEGKVSGRGAEVDVRRFAAGTLDLPRVLDDLAERRGARAVLCEGGPTLLREVVAAGRLDDLILTVAPLLVAGDEPPVLRGCGLHPPPRLALCEVLRGGDHLFLRYAVAP